MDFISDTVYKGRCFRALTIVDNGSRECLAIEGGQGIRGDQVVVVLERLKYSRGLPDVIQVENGSEVISKFDQPDSSRGTICLRGIVHCLVNSGFLRQFCMQKKCDHVKRTRLELILKEMHRVLKTGGLHIATTPAAWTNKLLKCMARFNLVSWGEIKEHKEAYNRDKLMPHHGMGCDPS